MTLLNSCAWICACALPPMVPNTSQGSPSRSAIAGISVCSVRTPGASSLRWPFCSEKKLPRACSRMPVPGTTMPEPNPK